MSRGSSPRENTVIICKEMNCDLMEEEREKGACLVRVSCLEGLFLGCGDRQFHLDYKQVMSAQKRDQEGFLYMNASVIRTIYQSVESIYLA